MNIMKKITKISFCLAAAAAMTVSSGVCSLTASAQLYKNDTGYYYTDENGDRLTGRQEINGKIFYFDDEGYAYTGFKEIDGNTYYFRPSRNNRMARGWLKINGGKYYFGEDGAMRTGWRTIGSKTYYFSSDGKVVTESFISEGMRYVFDGNGVLDRSKSGSVFSRSLTGCSSWGASAEEFLSANGITQYYTEDADMLHCYVFNVLNCMGEPVKIVAGFEDDKLAAVMVYPDDKSFSSDIKDKLGRMYEDFYSDDESAVWLGKEEMVIFGQHESYQVIWGYELAFALKLFEDI
ncbi:MAG: hypothetical protein IJ446_02095 [Oscillospiraceae bacterium]|nr:hypothetical protein [Oscillospiraceae bacterium]